MTKGIPHFVRAKKGLIMKQLLKLAVIGALLVATISVASAQTYNGTTHVDRSYLISSLRDKPDYEVIELRLAAVVIVTRRCDGEFWIHHAPLTICGSGCHALFISCIDAEVTCAAIHFANVSTPTFVGCDGSREGDRGG